MINETFLLLLIFNTIAIMLLLSGSAFDIELNTPQITEDQTDPLIRLLGKK